ncbi:ribosome maturation factor RimP [Luedemannella helvata]|uniref:Ribosome maturation factor RimP n=1 Tax=Luedemannella helvata TaxID=349315 RepID=A0ABN2KLA5_9ACTN
MAAQQGRRAASPSGSGSGPQRGSQRASGSGRAGAGSRRDGAGGARGGAPKSGGNGFDARPPRGEDLAAQRARLHDVIEPVVRDAGFDLEELKVSRMGRTHVVRVVVDGEDGISLDDVAQISRAASAALDEAELSGGAFTAEAYQLEVSSPGVDRPLTLPRHWRRNVNRLVKVKAGEKMLTGRVVAVAADGVTLDVNGTRHELAFGDLGQGHVQIEFSRLAELADEDIGEEFTGDEDDETDDELIIDEMIDDEDGKGRDEA